MLFYMLVPVFSFLLVLFQQTILNLFFFHQLNVEISLLLTIYAGFRMNLIRGAFLSLLLGFFIDCLTGALTGMYMLVYFVIFLISFLVSARVYVKRTAMIVAYTVFCTLLEGVLMVWLMEIIKGVHLENMVRIFLSQALVLGALSPALFAVFDRFGVFFNADEA